MAQLDALNELLSGVQRSIAMGVPGLEEKRDQIIRDIQLLLLGPQVQEPAPAATEAVSLFGRAHTCFATFSSGDSGVYNECAAA